MVAQGLDQDDGCGQAQRAVAVDILVDLLPVAVVVSRLPRREGPVWRKLLAPGESREPVEDERESRPLEQHEAKLVRTDLDADAVTFRDIEVEYSFAEGIHPKAIAAEAHEKRHGLVGVEALGAGRIARSILDDAVRVVQTIEALAKTVVVALVGKVEFPIAGGGRLSRDLVDAGGQLPHLELVGGGDGLAVEKETVEHDALGAAARAGEGEPQFDRPGCHNPHFGQRGHRRHPRDYHEHTEQAKPLSHSYLFPILYSVRPPLG